MPLIRMKLHRHGNIDLPRKHLLSTSKSDIQGQINNSLMNSLVINVPVNMDITFGFKKPLSNTCEELPK